ncbi:MATE family efflux transporter [Fusobacterium sp. MFO224]|uniref:MATE family efflux transporter n=1 Tax=Fusobacterium sp. MFO224 TaxID=3378070 RepID=UPI003853876D
MKNNLGKTYNFFSLIKFVFPNILMMLILSIYVNVDGIFVSRYVGTTALSAMNIMFPGCLSLVFSIGIMLGTGGGAIVAKKLGERKVEEARKNFTLIIILGIAIGLIFSLIGTNFTHVIAKLLGASDIQLPFSIAYGRMLFFFTPFLFLQVMFQTFFITAGVPALGLISTLGGGILNIILDYYFIVILKFGVAGAALASGLGYLVPSSIGLIYFGILKRGELHFEKTNFNKSFVFKSLINGSSEMVTNLAYGITTFLFNISFLKYYGEDGVAAITITLYLEFIFMAIYIGYSMGVSPLISYKYGSRDHAQLKKLFKYSIIFTGISSLFIFAVSRTLLPDVVEIFTHEGSNVYNIILKGFPLFSFSFLIIGYNVFASNLFTALSNGKVSALISFSRTLVFLVGTILLLPLILKEKGLWLAIPVAETFGLTVSILFIIIKKGRYKY